MSKYPYDNKSLYNLLTKVNLFFSPVFSSFRKISFTSLTQEANPQDIAQLTQIQKDRTLVNN